MANQPYTLQRRRGAQRTAVAAQGQCEPQGVRQAAYALAGWLPLKPLSLGFTQRAHTPLCTTCAMRACSCCCRMCAGWGAGGAFCGREPAGGGGRAEPGGHCTLPSTCTAQRGQNFAVEACSVACVAVHMHPVRILGVHVGGRCPMLNRCARPPQVITLSDGCFFFPFFPRSSP